MFCMYDFHAGYKKPDRCFQLQEVRELLPTVLGHHSYKGGCVEMDSTQQE